MLLNGRVALVTGASSGIGAAVATAFAEAGSRITLFARRRARLESLAGQLAARGESVLACAGDVRNEADCQAAIELTVERFGGLDILVNNAGVMLLGPIVDADPSEWHVMVETNLLGAMYMTRHALPHLIASPQADIVTVSSTAGRTARGGASVYSATKSALNAFNESLRQELSSHNVRVGLIAPGYVETELREHITHEASRKKSLSTAESIEVLQAKDIAAAALFMVAQQSRVAINEILVRPSHQS